MNNGLLYHFAKADKSIFDFIYCFSSLQNLSAVREGVIIPNGKIDLSFSKATDGQFRISLLGLETKPKFIPKQNNISSFFAINFNPLAVEYIF
ncbi:hypothetical protein [Arachidicoccus ginsenosidimutans]|uniref:hypothetical protein n=1 Tax=Arachidicoccus sp. BS20 TaxID=1850526 RepID=UPI000A88F032|nr:hypothetical protein [Arachidicoccus sp. BS20]